MRIEFLGTGMGVVAATDTPLRCLSNCQVDVLTGTRVSLLAMPIAGSIFAGWSGVCSGRVLNCTFTVNGDTRVAVEFIEEPLPRQQR